MIARILTDASIASDARLVAAERRWSAQLVSEGYSVASDVSPAGASVAQVHALRGACAHLQILGPVAVPQVICNPDGHGSRAGDCDAVYATDDLSLWKPQSDGSFASSVWPADASCSVSRMDASSISADPAGAVANMLDRSVAYRTGALEFDGLGVMVDRFPDAMDVSLHGRLRASMEAVVGAGNVLDATSAYPDEQFFANYAGRSFLTGCLFSGGDEFRQANGVFGHLFYIGATADAASGSVRIAFPRIYCSYGWEFERWPFQRGLLLGGSLAVLWDPGCDLDLSGWSDSVSIGEALRVNHKRGSAFLDTIQGDATLCRRVQDMGVSLAQYTADQAALGARVSALEASGAAMSSQVAALAAALKGAGTGGTQGTLALPLVINCGPGDSYAVSGTTWAGMLAVDASAVTNPLPAIDYTSGRGGPAAAYVIPGLGAREPLDVRLHLAEPNVNNTVGRRLFDVAANGQIVISRLDIFARAGALNRATVAEFSATADSAGSLRLDFTVSAGSADPNAYVCGVEVLAA